MYWSLVVVHILVLTVISLNTFPIELKEIVLDDVLLVDKQRKGRFIAVNQTTFLPSEKPIEVDLLQAKKSSKLPKKKSSEDKGVMENEVQKSVKPDDVNQQKPSDWNSTMTLNNNGVVDYPVYLNNPQACDYSSFSDYHFGDLSNQRPDIIKSEIELLSENCCHFNPLVETFTSDFLCADDVIVPVENAVC